MELKQTALHETHLALGAKMVPFAGYEMPVRYSSDIAEHQNVRDGVGVFDVSHMGEFFLRGPQALALIQKVTSNDASRLVDGQAQYSCLPNATGGIVDDLIVYRMSSEEYMLVVNASNIEKDWNWISQHNDMGAEMENKSDAYSLFAVQGPKAVEAMQALTPIELAAMKFYTFEIGSFAGVDEVIVSATGYTGSGGFEIYVKNEDAKAVWDKIMEAGAPYGILPTGLGARDTLRLEMGYCLYGNDIDDTTSPIEAGLGWITKFSKDFINKAAIEAQKENGVERKLIGFVMEEKGIPRHGYAIKNEAGEEIGVVTSGTMSPSLGYGLGLAYVKTAFAKADTPIKIVVRNRELQARVQRPPFYKA